ncbi:dolichol-phosphate mannosyltransferase [Nocardioides flavus (ex Wang et al. 2016)]|uniref:Dolichol-phosphate mannosyltransferase n=1 Tax=Nocardioides flavus (ex Wang et al. 2016) TaxID=2058780 RepID=A0ABQ3HNR4_9ACTN|nr:dolichol-phosphate mannosyltransferase [Nocardioides flavus (ex Wang et al. 2016)]
MIVVPTYNEASTIGDLLDGIGACRDQAPDEVIDVLVVDDNSPDQTQDIVRSHPGFGGWVHLLPRASKDGLGAAYRAGFAAAVRAGYDVVVQMDADGSHPATAVLPLLVLVRTNDVAIGSRYVPGGRTENWPGRRRALSWAANTYARTVLRLRTHDATSGFRAWRAEAIAAAGVPETTSNGYGFQVENTWRCERRGLRLAEHPITFVERTAGDSKMSPGVAREAALLVLRWRFRELTRRRTTRPAAPAVVHDGTARA